MAYYLAGSLRFKKLHEMRISRLEMIKDLKRSFAFMYHVPNWRYVLRYGSYAQIVELHKKYIE